MIKFKTIFIFLLGFVIGAIAFMVLISLVLSSVNKNTITFQTDSPWFNQCEGEESFDFVFTFGTLDCEDLGLKIMEPLQDG